VPQRRVRAKPLVLPERKAYDVVARVSGWIQCSRQPYAQPPEPDGLDVDGLLRGLYRYCQAGGGTGPRAQLLASGVALPRALRAQDAWSATATLSCTPMPSRGVLYVTAALADSPGPVVATSDWMRAVPDVIRPWMPSHPQYDHSNCDHGNRRIARIDRMSKGSVWRGPHQSPD
jgi:pyruvate dehydrogenase complex dehydrogenase (E1) component